MERNISYETDQDAFREEWLSKEQDLSNQIEQGRKLVGKVNYTRRDLLSIAALTSSLNVDGHRSDLVILKAARAQAAFDGRTTITDHDIALAAELTLPHRIKRGPFHQAEVNAEQLQERIEQLVGQAAEGTPEEQPTPEDSAEKKSRS
jgi:Mg-chelatase subunit ChlI